jgi:hypothetical protein
MAKDKVHEDGYNYKKGKSRSTKHSTTSDESAPKRSKIDSAERVRRINEIHEDIGHIDTQIGFKNRRIEAATVTKSYKTCDELSAEIATLNMQRRELVKELGVLEKKAKKSTKYIKAKNKKRPMLSYKSPLLRKILRSPKGRVEIVTKSSILRRASLILRRRREAIN